MTIIVTKPELNIRDELSRLDKPSGIAGEALLRAETPQEQFNLIGAGRKNIIINGAMRVYQRNLGTFLVSTTSSYIIDRFACYNAVGSMNAEQSTDSPDGFAHSLKVTCVTANASPGGDEGWIQYKPEAQDMFQLGYGTANPKSITISFWVKSTVTGLAGFYFYQNDAGRAYQARYTVYTSDTWEWKSITIPGDASGNFDDNNAVGAELRWYLAGKAGDDNVNEWGTNPSHTSSRTPSTYNFNSQVGNVFAITGVQLEVGKVATPFEHRSYGEELSLCQRYYQRWSGFDTALMARYNANTGTANMMLQYWTPMRTNPSCGHAGTWRTTSGFVAPGTIGGYGAHIRVVSAVSDVGVNEIRYLESYPDGYIYADAEL